MRSPDASADRFTLILKTGDSVFREGDPGAELFLVEEGRVELSSSAAPQHMQVLEAGDFFGTTSLLEDRPRETSARAAAPSRLLRIDRSTFGDLLRARPDIALVMLQRMAELAAPPDTRPTAQPAQPARLMHAKSNVQFPLAGADLGIGRRAAGIVPDIDLTDIDPDKTLSRRHARITRGPKGYVLREEEARNGTFVNGDRLAAGQTVALEEGDRVRFGLVELVFRSK
jgi:CRP-like cAMP-binding protein